MKLNLTQHMRRTLEEFLAWLDMNREALSACETHRLEMHEVTVWKTRVPVILKGGVGYILEEETSKQDF